jgi:hypothetical protein
MRGEPGGDEDAGGLQVALSNDEQTISSARARALPRRVAVRNYAMLAPFFWTRGSGKRLRGDPDAQVVAMYFSTSPGANLIGLYYLPFVNIAHETGLSTKRARDAIAKVEAVGYASYDFDRELVWIPNSAQFEIGAKLKAGDKRRGKVVAELAQVGRHPFIGAFLRAYGTAYGLDERILGCPIDGASENANEASPILGPVRSGSISDQDRFAAAENPRPGVGGERSDAVAPGGRVQRSLPPPGEPASADVVAWADSWGIEHEHPRFAQFVHHHRGRGVPFASWSEAWKAWRQGAVAVTATQRAQSPLFGQPLAALPEPEDLFPDTAATGRR